MTVRLLTLLTAVIAIAVAISIQALDPERLSALGGILSGAGSLLAVLWFSAGLRYQSHQLEDQRRQFAAQFQYLKEGGRRDALVLVQQILERAEEKTIVSFGAPIAISELPVKYMDAGELKTILESTNPHEVFDACSLWMKKEGAAMTLLQGIKSAAEVYFRSINATDIDFSKTPEEFYFIYSPRFSNEPFFNAVSGPAYLLSEIMVRFQPARNAALIAYFSATAKTISREVIKMEKLRADIQKHVADGYPLPAIATDV